MASGSINVGKAEKRLMANQLIQAMNGHLNQANGTDFSRLAWLYLHVGQVEQARDTVRAGLETEPGNMHLLKLRDRLGEASSE